MENELISTAGTEPSVMKRARPLDVQMPVTTAPETAPTDCETQDLRVKYELVSTAGSVPPEMTSVLLPEKLVTVAATPVTAANPDTSEDLRVEDEPISTTGSEPPVMMSTHLLDEQMPVTTMPDAASITSILEKLGSELTPDGQKWLEDLRLKKKIISSSGTEPPERMSTHPPEKLVAVAATPGTMANPEASEDCDSEDSLTAILPHPPDQFLTQLLAAFRRMVGADRGATFMSAFIRVASAELGYDATVISAGIEYLGDRGGFILQPVLGGDTLIEFDGCEG